MDWKTFVVEMTGSLAWPVAVVSIALIFRDKLGELLQRLKRLRHKDTEVEFSEKMNELVRERELEATEETKKETEVGKTDEDYSFLMRLANISPRSAIQESFRVLENAAFKAVAKIYPEIYASNVRKPWQLLSMLEGEVLSPDEYYQFNELRKLRNSAAHDMDFDLRGTPVEAYVDIALSLARQLDHAKRKSET